MSASKSKKIFVIAFVLFMLIILAISYDMANKTTFPGSKGNLKERITNPDAYEKEGVKTKQDSILNDSEKDGGRKEKRQ